MESVGSNTPSPPPPSPVTRAAAFGHYNHAQHVADRIIRALQHPLRLVHRSEADFFILGATGNVYKVTIAATPSCSCPDRTVPCKHILFVLLRVLGLCLDNPCVWRRTLRPQQIAHLLSVPTASDVIASTRACERFHQLYSGGLKAAVSQEDKSDAVCPVCLDAMEGGADLVTCGTCGNSLHGECLARWKRSRGRRALSCVVCRAKWKERRDQDQYINLAAYMSEAEVMGGDIDEQCGS